MVSRLMIKVGNRTYIMTHQHLINGVTVNETINGDGNPFRFGKVSSAKLTFQFNIDLFDIELVANSDYIVWVCKMMNESSLTVRDMFYVYDIEVHNKIATVTAYNWANKLEVSAYDFLSSFSTTGGVTIASFLTSLTTWWKNTYHIPMNPTVQYSGLLTNIQNQKVYPELIDLNDIQDITVRQLFEYCAEIMNAFVISRGSLAGVKLIFKGLDLNSTTNIVDNTKYVSTDLGYWAIPGTNAFLWGSADGMGESFVLFLVQGSQYASYNIYDQSTRQINYTVPSYIKRQIYYLEANPLVNYSAATYGNYAVGLLANQIVKAPDYYAGEVVLLNDFGWDLGDKLIVDGKPIFIMEKTIQPSGVIFKSTGSMDRNFQETRRGGYIILNFKEQTT